MWLNTDSARRPFHVRILLNQPLLVLANVPAGVGRTLVQYTRGKGLAACVNILAPVQSVYRWQGKIQRDAEIPLLIKTTQGRYQELEQAIAEAHPYDVPEIIALPITAGARLSGVDAG
jgi:periplasmic divalent cation tolerance protein